MKWTAGVLLLSIIITVSAGLAEPFDNSSEDLRIIYSSSIESQVERYISLKQGRRYG